MRRIYIYTWGENDHTLNLPWGEKDHTPHLPLGRKRPHPSSSLGRKRPHPFAQGPGPPLPHLSGVSIIILYPWPDLPRILVLSWFTKDMGSGMKCKELISDQISMYIVSNLNSQVKCSRPESSRLRSLAWFTKDMFLDPSRQAFIWSLRTHLSLTQYSRGIICLQPIALSLLEICVECHLPRLSHFLEYVFAYFEINWIHYYETNQDWSPRE